MVDSLTNKGAVFVDEISDIPQNSNTIFSAHGVSDSVESDAKNKSLTIVDATCPLVKKVHIEAIKYHLMNQRALKSLMKCKVQQEEFKWMIKD